MLFTPQSRLTHRAALLTPCLLLAIICHKPALAESAQKHELTRPPTIRPETVSGLETFFKDIDYSWSQLEKGVPPFILEGMPADINGPVSSTARKRAFFMGLLPMVLLANQEIAREREDVVQILERYRVMETRGGDQQRLDEIMARYSMRGNPYIEQRTRTRLLSRVDTIPPSLVLAQAANESAWGTSRFAQAGNNLFGEWTFRPGTGIVPENRPAGKTHEVRRFSSIYASIRSYMNNLNSHNAYAKLRDIREQLRNTRQPVTGLALAQGLYHYSERGDDYIDEIRAMIRQNKLSLANTAFLRQARSSRMASPAIFGSGLHSTRHRLTGQFAPSR